MCQGLPQLSGPLQEVIVLIVAEERGRQEPEVLRQGLSWRAGAPHNLHLAFPTYCCVAQRGASHPVSSGPRAGGDRTTPDTNSGREDGNKGLDSPSQPLLAVG